MGKPRSEPTTPPGSKQAKEAKVAAPQPSPKRAALKSEAKHARNKAKEATKVLLQEAVTDATKKVASAVVERTEQHLEPPWWRARKEKAPRAPISRDAIVDAALRILDAEGVDALTVRRLATELGTGPATLYWHIAGKDELGELVYDRIMAAIELPEPDPARWEEQLRDVATQSYRLLIEHNDAVKLSIGRVPTGPSMLRVMEWMLGLLRRTGMNEDMACYFGDLLGRYIDASVLEEHGPVAADGGGQPDMMAMIIDYFTSLPPAQYPNLTAMAGTMFRIDNARRFDMGLDILLRGLATYIERPAAP